jgi:hypothetical protein
LILASGLLVLLVRRWSGSHRAIEAAAPAAPPPSAAGDEAYHARLRRELEEWR